jgi:hypothetical protein
MQALAVSSELAFLLCFAPSDLFIVLALLSHQLLLPCFLDPTLPVVVVRVGCSPLAIHFVMGDALQRELHAVAVSLA